jgi:hypothetical protein
VPAETSAVDIGDNPGMMAKRLACLRGMVTGHPYAACFRTKVDSEMYLIFKRQ